MEGQQQIPPNQAQPQRVQLSVTEFAAKYRSKRECYNFLAVDAGVYLPPYGKCFSLSLQMRSGFVHTLILFFFLTENVTIYFLKALISGEKKRIKGKDVAWIAVP